MPSEPPAVGSPGPSPSVHANSGRPYCGGCWTARFAERCDSCKRPFGPKARVVIFGDAKLHPECFRCSGPCGRELDGKFMKHGEKPYCATCYANAFSPRCGGCGLPIFADGERYVVHKGRKFHRKCFCCAACGVSLAGGEHYERDGQTYCSTDFKRLFGEQCTLCGERLLTWLVAPSGEVYCRKHEGDPPCHGCGRLVGGKKGGVDLNDGRVSCPQCALSAVETLAEASEWYGKVRSFLTSRGVARLPEASEVHLQLCERSTLLSRNSMHLSHAHHAHKCPIGLTSAEELSTVQSGSGRLLERRRVIGSVSLLKGLPSQLCAATIAHELGHVYMHLGGFDMSLPPALAEGVCELFAYLWLTAGSGKGGGGGSSAFRVKMMTDSKDAIYGQGFRDALAAYYAVDGDLMRLLEEVRTSRRLPSLPMAGSPARLLGRSRPAAAPSSKSPASDPRSPSWPPFGRGPCASCSAACTHSPMAGGGAPLAGFTPTPPAVPRCSPAANGRGGGAAGANGFGRAL